MNESSTVTRPTSFTELDALCKVENVGGLQRALYDAERGYDGLTGRGCLADALHYAVQHKAYCSLRYVLEHGANVAMVQPRLLQSSGYVSRPMVEMLVHHGWDVNTRLMEQTPLLWLVVDDEDLCRWLLGQGASVTPRNIPGDNLSPLLVPTLLEAVAARGSCSTLKLMLANNAPLGGRVLHFAVERAGASGNTHDLHASGMAIVKFLVEELGVDVNQLDRPDERRLANHWGTPLSYLRLEDPRSESTMNTISYLLGKGANPDMKNRDGIAAIDRLSSVENYALIEAIRRIQMEQYLEGQP